MVLKAQSTEPFVERGFQELQQGGKLKFAGAKVNYPPGK